MSTATVGIESVESAFPRAATSASRGWRGYVNRVLAAEVSAAARQFAEVIQVAPRPEDSGALLEAIDAPSKGVVARPEDIPTPAAGAGAGPRLILLNGNFNHHHDIEALLAAIRPRLGRSDRVAALVYNPYLRGIYALANRLGIRKGEAPSTFVTFQALANLCQLGGFELVRGRYSAYVPAALLGLGTLFNRVLPAVPLLRRLGLAAVTLLRPVVPEPKPRSVSIVIPARNERGNIEDGLRRLECLLRGPGGGRLESRDVEVIFVEGHSKDGTWEEIQRVAPLYADRFAIQTHQQTGKGKADAVRLGFGVATRDVLTILDADLTMPPELLGRFLEAMDRGLGDFVNGNRLTYPMEGQAMKFLNLLGNIFFAKALSWVLDAPLGDSLCGTKVVSRADYARMVAWRQRFGDFDPFGDFELIFPAAELGLGIVDLPVRYRDRVYGQTNIRRFYHGMILLRMTLVGLLRIKLGRAPERPRR